MLPEEFLSRMKKMLGAEYEEFVNSYNRPCERAIRINIKRITDYAFFSVFPYKCERIPYARNGYYVDIPSDEKIGSDPLHFAGAFYVQEPSAMAPICAVDIPYDALVLDMCAAPGGKSSQIAASLQRGVLVSNDIVKSRAATLMGNVERQGFGNVVVTSTDPKTLASWYEETFDLTICDAPCSGEGMFRKNRDAAAQWSENNVRMCAARQREILDCASKTVRRGGYLLYSTCTFSKEENEDVVCDFLERHTDFFPADVPRDIANATSEGIGLPFARRFYPHRGRGEGQFFALMRKNGDGARGISNIRYTDAARPLSSEEEKITHDFLNSVLGYTPRGRIVALRNEIFVAPNFPIPPHGVFCAGVKLGAIEKGRFVPHHHFFSAFGKSLFGCLDLPYDSADLRKYIGGEVIYCKNFNGWVCISCAGCTVGGGKASIGEIKNFYPKGLRRKI